MRLRESTKNWKEGDTRSLLKKGNITSRRSKEEVAASKAATKSKKEEKERQRREKAERRAEGIKKVSALENALADEDREQENAFPRYRKGRSESKSSFHLTDSIVDLPEQASSPSETEDEDPTPKVTKVVSMPPSKNKTAAAIIDSSSDEEVTTQPVTERGSVMKISKPNSMTKTKARPKPRPVKKVGVLVCSDEEDDLDRLGKRHAHHEESSEEKSEPLRRKRRLRKLGDISDLDEPAQPGADAHGNSGDAMDVDDDNDDTAHKNHSRASNKKKSSKAKAADGKKRKKRDNGVRAAIIATRTTKHAEQTRVNNEAVLTASKIDSGLLNDWDDRAERGYFAITQDRDDDSDDVAPNRASAWTNNVTSNRPKSVAAVVTTSIVPLSQPSRSRAPSAGFSTAPDNGRLEDEDDSAEREDIRLSPTKAGARVSNRKFVELTTPDKKRIKISEVTNDNLPNGALTHFRHGFVTNFGYWLGCTRDPWTSNSSNAFLVMQKCWDFVYGQTLVYNITGIRDVVFILGDQRWKEMRCTFGNVAINALEEHFKIGGKKTNGERKTEAKHLAEGRRYLYKVYIQTKSGKLQRKQPFFGPLIIKTFSAFFKWTKKRDYDWKEVVGKPPIGALALATVAVERAISHWAGLPDDVADEIAERPYVKVKSKARTTKPQAADETVVVGASSGNTPKRNKTSVARIGEFNQEKWSDATKEWIASAVAKGFDSMAVMQPLMDMANDTLRGHNSQDMQPAPVASSGSRLDIPEDTTETEA